VGFDDFVEAAEIAGLLIVRMVAPGMMTKYPFYRVLVRIWANFQDFVIVGKCRVTQESSPAKTAR
jgi:hypothetical protein